MNVPFPLILSAFVLTLGACTGSTKSAGPEFPAVEQEPEQKTEIACYSYTENKDTVLLTIKTIGDIVTNGDLVYQLYEKDKNTGKFYGAMENGLLVGSYQFESEGQSSERQVVFKVEGDKLIEGTGETETDKGHVRFKDYRNLNYASSIVLKKVDCKE